MVGLLYVVGCDGRFSASVMGGLMGGFLYVIRCGRVIVMVGSFQHQKNIGIKINKISHNIDSDSINAIF